MPDPPTEQRMGLTTFRRYTWWSVTGTTVSFLLVVVGEWVLDGDVAILPRAAGGVALAVTVPACVVLISRRMSGATATGRPPMPWFVAGSAAAAVLGTSALAVHNYGLWSYAPATMVALGATYVRPRHRWVLIAGAAAIAAAAGGAVAWVSGDGLVYAAAFPAGLVASIAWVTLGMVWSWEIAERLNEARRLSAELAVKDERLRFAADLHDIQGHHLQVIALKSELAARLAERDPARAAAEMRDVQRLSAQALADTRAVVAGYRRTTLDDEIANATKVMAAADIDARMNLDPSASAAADGIPPASRHLLGLVMREATTNVLRHSRARTAEVDYRIAEGVARLSVRNDGASGPSARPGTGLRTLAERLEAASGSLTWHHEGDRFVVAASLPVTSDATEAR